MGASVTGRRGAAPAAAFLFFAAASVAMTWPLVAHPGRFVSDPGDPYLNAWILHWDWQQLFRDPAHLFDGNIFYPARLALAFSENLFGAAVFGFPLYFAGVSPLAVYNVLFLLGITLSGFGAWALVRELTGSGAAALVAGIAYAFAPFRFDQLPHIQMQWAGWIPLAILFLWRYLESARRRDLVLFTVFFVANAWTCVYYAVFGAIAVVVTLAVHPPAGGSRGALVRPLGFAFAAALVAIAPLYLPYIAASRLYHFHRSLAEMTTYSAGPASFFSAGSRSRVYAGLTHRFERPEAQLFPGLLAIALAAGTWRAIRRRPAASAAADRRSPPRPLDAAIALLIAVRVAVAVTGGFRIGPLSIHEPYRLSFLIFLLTAVRLSIAFPRWSRYASLADFLRRNRATPAERWAVGMLLTGVVVALGTGVFLFREVVELFPFVFGAIRCPARGIVLAHLGLGALAALFVARIGRPAASFALAALMLVELRAAPLSLFEGDPSPPASVSWVAARAFPGGALELPMKISDDLMYVLWATTHDFPIVNGYSGFFPKDYEAVRAAFAGDTISSDAPRLLREKRVAVILYHRGRATASEQRSLSRFFMGAIPSGTLAPVTQAGGGADDTVILAAAGAERFFPSSSADRSRAVEALAHPVASPTRPQGWYDEPHAGAVIRGSTVRGSGWAAAPEGMGRIAVFLDGRDVGSATYGSYRPDVPMVKPGVACGQFCGYRFRIDGVPPGRHTVRTRYIGRNGGVNGPPDVEIRVRR